MNLILSSHSKMNQYLYNSFQELGDSGYDRFFVLSMYVFAFSMILSVFLLQIASGLLLISWIVRVSSDPAYRWRKTLLDFPLLALLAVRVLSIFFSINVHQSMEVLWKEAPFYILFFVFTQSFDINNKKLFRAVLLCFLAGGLIGSCYGVYIHLVDPSVRASSITSGYMTFGMYLTAVLALSFPFMDVLFRRKILFWGIFTVLFIALLFTLNRTHLAIMVCVLVFMGIVKQKWLIWAALLFFTVAILVSPSVIDRISTLHSPVKTSSDRNILWPDAWSRLLDHPFVGYGPYTFRSIYTHFDEMQDKGVAGWHNDFLQLPLESGFPALLFFLWLMAGSLYLCFHNKPWSGHSWSARLSLGVGMMLITFYFSAFFGASAQDVITSQLFKFGLAMSALLPSVKGEDS